MSKVQGLGFRAQGAGFRVQCSGCRVQGSGCRVQGAGRRVQVAGCRVQGAGRRVQGALGDLESESLKERERERERERGERERQRERENLQSESLQPVPNRPDALHDCSRRGTWLRVRVQGLRFRVQGFGFRVLGFGFRVLGSGFRVSGFGFRCGCAPRDNQHALGVPCRGRKARNLLSLARVRDQPRADPLKALRGGIPSSFLEPFPRSWRDFAGNCCQKLTSLL